MLTRVKLSDILPELDDVAFFLKAGKKDDPYEILTDKATEGVAEGIEALQIEGLHAYKDH